MKWSHGNGTHEDRPRYRLQRRVRRDGLCPGTRSRTRRRQPGSTVTVIADAAGTGKPAARTALLEMEKAGTATRVEGTKPGIPDTWILAEPAPNGTAPEAASEAGQPGDEPAGSLDGAIEGGTAGGARPDRTDEADDPAPGAEAGAPAVPARRRRSPGRTTPRPKTPARTPARTTSQRRAATRPTATPPATRTPRRTPAAKPGTPPDPALVTKLTEHLRQVKANADEAELDLATSGDLKTVLAGLDEIADQAAQARRVLKAAIGGRKAPAVRPGGLRDKALAHLVANPGKEFTPHDIYKVLDHSSGAIANALETLVNLGEAEVATEKPPKFRRAAQPAETAPAADGTDDTAGADGAEQDTAGLAGAA